MRTIRFRPEVAVDLREAAEWYNEKRDGLGDEFLDEFWSAVDTIGDRPLSFGIASTGLRACRLARFPYVVHFRCGDGEIVVVAVMHGGRDTSAWSDRV
jgi:plasmid stabilization system protein ParE